MMQCTDIDELMIDFLYRELDSAREAEFRAHVDGCAKCGAELAGLERTRQAVRSLPPVEPSPAISARLLAEAAKRAPAQKGLVARFVDWLQPLFAHPGLVAAASVVMIAGVAGFLALHGKVTKEEAAAPQPPRPAATSTITATAPMAPAATPQAADVPPADALREGAEGAKDNGYYQNAGPTPPARAAEAEKKDLDQTVSLDSPKPTPAKHMASGPGSYDTRDGRLQTKEEAQSLAKPPVEEPARGKGGEADDALIGGDANAPVQQEQGIVAHSEATGGATATPSSPSPPPPPAAPAPIAKQPKATTSADAKQASLEQTHAQAKNIASGGDCKDAMTLWGNIERMDAEFYRRRVVGDPDYDRCNPQKRKAQQDRQQAAPVKAAPQPAPQQDEVQVQSQ